VKTTEVRLGSRSYPVFVGEGILARLSGLLTRLGFSSAPVVVSNPRVFKLHGDSLRRSLEAAYGPAPVVFIGDGERFKNIASLQKVYQGLIRAGADRRSWVLALGGGVVGDLAGFAAATFVRGIPYVNVPTTLLAQVDSAIGGKVGINLKQGKNLIGAFHQPSAVLSDIGTLRTLPPRELASGLYEVLKCGVIRSEKLILYIERNLQAILSASPSALEHVVLEASRIKAAVVSSDEMEAKQRMILNYGHTVGHALEAATGYRRFKHGEAVAWGMMAAVGFGRELGLLEEKSAQRLLRLIHRVTKLPTLRGISPGRVWNALGRDKKFAGGRIRMVLLPRLGAAEIRNDIDPANLKRFLKNFIESSSNI